MTAVNSNRVASVIGYQLLAGNFSVNSPNLPQRLAVLCEANTDNQATLDVSEWEATNLKAVGTRYGYGSPAYLIARIALPILSGIPLVFYPQSQASGATSKIYEITPIGVATANADHTLVIAGRNGLDAQFYTYTVQIGDTSNQITAKQVDTLAAVLGCPFKATDDDYVTTLESKWKGATAEELKVSVNTNGNDAGITYTVNDVQSAAGTPSIAAALTLMTPKWNTIGINSYGLNSNICDALEAWNGIPESTPTGRYQPTIMKPAIFLTGSVLEDPSSLTDPRKAEVTISISPAPVSDGLSFEAAANDAAIWAVVAQNKPALDVLNKYYIDMPTPILIGAMADSNDRDRIVKLGCSTVDLVNSKYQLKDPVTTYHPDGDLQPAFRWRRDLMLDFNLKFRYRILEETFLMGKVIAGDQDDVSDQDVIKPKQWKTIIIDFLLKNAVSDALISDIDFSAESLVVQIDSNNPNRFNTSFKYKKTGIARISATEVQSGFNTFNI